MQPFSRRDSRRMNNKNFLFKCHGNQMCFKSRTKLSKGICSTECKWLGILKQSGINCKGSRIICFCAGFSSYKSITRQTRRDRKAKKGEAIQTTISKHGNLIVNSKYNGERMQIKKNGVNCVDLFGTMK